MATLKRGHHLWASGCDRLYPICTSRQPELQFAPSARQLCQRCTVRALRPCHVQARRGCECAHAGADSADLRNSLPRQSESIADDVSSESQMAGSRDALSAGRVIIDVCMSPCPLSDAQTENLQAIVRNIVQRFHSTQALVHSCKSRWSQVCNGLTSVKLAMLRCKAAAFQLELSHACPALLLEGHPQLHQHDSSHPT